MGEDIVADLQEVAPVVRQFAVQMVGEAAHAVSDIADNFGLREIDLIDIRAVEIDMDDLRAAVPHDEGRFFDGIVADGDDQIGAADRPVDVIVLGQGRGADEQRGISVDRALAHLGCEERDP
jgi:hypothetical protein